MARRDPDDDISKLSPTEAKGIYLSRLAGVYIMRDNIRKAISKGLDPDTCTQEAWTAAGLPGEPKSKLALSFASNDCAALAKRAGIEHEHVEI